MDTIEKLNNLITDLDAVVGTFKLHFCIVSDSAESEDDPDTLDETTASTDALKMISGYASKILETFFSLLKRLLSLPSDPNEMERFSPATLCASLSSIKKDCSKATALSDIYPMQLSGFLENFLEETIDKLLEIPFHEFSATLESLTEASDLCAESAKVANMVLHTLTNDCVDYFCSFLEWDVSRLLSVDFAAKVSDGLDSFWSKLFDFVRKSSMLNRPSIASHAPATMIILLKAHVVSSLSHLSIENVYQAYKKKALSSAIDATKIRGFAQEAQDCASTLLGQYVYEKSRDLQEKFIARRYSQTLFLPSDLGALSPWTELIAALDKESGIIELLFPDDGVLNRKEKQRLNSAEQLLKSPPTKSSNLGLRIIGIDKVFAEKTAFFPRSVDGKRGEILTALVNAILKVTCSGFSYPRQLSSKCVYCFSQRLG